MVFGRIAGGVKYSDDENDVTLDREVDPLHLIPSKSRMLVVLEDARAHKCFKVDFKQL